VSRRASEIDERTAADVAGKPTRQTDKICQLTVQNDTQIVYNRHCVNLWRWSSCYRIGSQETVTVA